MLEEPGKSRDGWNGGTFKREDGTSVDMGFHTIPLDNAYGTSPVYTFIDSPEEIYRFWLYAVPRVEKDQVLFFSVSARNKLLSVKEREVFELGRSEMIEKTIIRTNDFPRFLAKIRSKEMNRWGLLTKAGVPYPDKCLRIYWNLNATSVRKVIAEQRQLVAECNDELLNAALKGSPEALDVAYHKIRRLFDATLGLYARASSEKLWTDYEVDFERGMYNQESYEYADSIRKMFLEFFGKGNFLILSSPGGLHFPIKTVALREFASVIKADPSKRVLAELARAAAGKKFLSIRELNRNSNDMVILPGTIAFNAEGAKQVVRVLNWDDFSKQDILKPVPT